MQPLATEGEREGQALCFGENVLGLWRGLRTFSVRRYRPQQGAGSQIKVSIFLTFVLRQRVVARDRVHVNQSAGEDVWCSDPLLSALSP